MGAVDSKDSEFQCASEETIIETLGNEDDDEVEDDSHEETTTHKSAQQTLSKSYSIEEPKDQPVWAIASTLLTQNTSKKASTPSIQEITSTCELQEDEHLTQRKPVLKPIKDKTKKDEKEILEEITEITRELDHTLQEPQSRKSSSGTKGKSKMYVEESSHQQLERTVSTESNGSSTRVSLKSTLNPRYVARKPEEWDVQVTDIEGFDMNKFKAANQRSTAHSPLPSERPSKHSTHGLLKSSKSRYSEADDELISMIEEQY